MASKTRLAGTYFQKVQDKESEREALTSRMDKDKDLYYLKSYQLLDQEGRPIPQKRVHNITMNEPALFGHRAIAILQSAFQQIEAKGKGMTDSETSYVESFCEDMTYEGDSRLSNRGIPNLYAWNCEHIAVRGSIAVRVLVREDKKKGLIVDIVPQDTRYVTHETDQDGLLWLAYKTSRTADQIEQEYGDKVRPQGKTVVLDVYDRDHNEIWIGDKKVKEQEHPYPGYVPCVYEDAWAGSTLTDDDAVSHRGESIFALDRDLYPELNKAMSVLQTLNMMTFLQPMQYFGEAGTGAELPELPPYGVGAVVAVDGKGFFPMPIADIRQATRYLLSNLQGALQRGSLTWLDYGNLTFPLSAVAIATLTESKDQLFVPRLQALAMFYRKLYKMIIKQVRAVGHTIEIGEEGHKGKYDPKKLQGDYQISMKFYHQSPEQVIANYQVAQAAAAAGVSHETIVRDILKFPNPAEEIMKRKSEDAEEFVPALKLYRYVHALIDRGRDIEARIVAPTVIQMLTPQAPPQPQGQPAPQPAKGKPEPTNLMPLLEGGGGRGRGPGAESPEGTQVREEHEKEQMRSNMRVRRETEKEA